MKPPKPVYADPAELVSKSKAKAQTGTVETWSVSEVDKKGKKKKGTLGVGNGAMFFASESDKVSTLCPHPCSNLPRATSSLVNPGLTCTNHLDSSAEMADYRHSIFASREA